jgi:hydroxymethylbilane synthase
MEILAHLNSDSVKKRIHVERKILNLLDGGCQLPLGAYCPNNNDVFVSFTKNNLEASQLYRFDFPETEVEIQNIVNAIQQL